VAARTRADPAELGEDVLFFDFYTATRARLILLLDQVAPPDTGLWRQFMASPSAIAQAIAPLLAEHADVVDEVWLRDAQGEVHSLRVWVD
jgi:hypothetical protein